MKRRIIYFLGQTNSTRSPMAEGFAKEYLDFDWWEVRSAGIENKELNPLTREVMQERGIDISNQRTSLVDTTVMDQAEIVVTLSDEAKAQLPARPEAVKNEFWEIEDPEKTTGTKAEKLAAFRRVRDQIDTRIKDFVEREKERDRQ